MSIANVNGQSDTRRLAGLLGWLAAVSLFAAGLVTALLQFDITASPPRKTAPNDLLEGTLAFFQNESDRWPQELASLLLFTVGFLALIGLVALVRSAVGRDDPWLMLGTLVLASAGLLLIWRGARNGGLFSPTWRGLTLALAVVLAVAVVTMVAEVDILSDVVTAVGAAILTPIWAVTTARGLPAAPREVWG